MYLDFLKDWDAGYSWGAAGLAYLYRSLDDATQRAEDTSVMCGCVWGLSIWMWERIPVGRPKKLRSREWTDYGQDDEDDRYPTVAYAWDVVCVYTGTSDALYKVFSNELDALMVFQVHWRPYDEREWGFELNVMCRQDRLLWRCIVPMICVYAVEYHLPHHVAAQFGKVQRTPTGGLIDTGGYDLHLMSRQKNQSITDCGEQHARYVKEWNEWKTRKDVDEKVVEWSEYEDHMLWYDDGIKHRLRLRPQWTTTDAKELYDDDSENEAYNDSIRELKGGFSEYGPLMNRVSSELNKSIFEASDALSSIPGTRDSENKLTGTMKKFVTNTASLWACLGALPPLLMLLLLQPRCIASLHRARPPRRLGWFKRTRRSTRTKKVKMKKRTRSEQKKNMGKKRNRAMRRRSTTTMTDLHLLRQPSLRRGMRRRWIGQVHPRFRNHVLLTARRRRLRTVQRTTRIVPRRGEGASETFYIVEDH